MTPSQKKAINNSKTMKALKSAMLDGAKIVFRDDERLVASGDVRAQVRTCEMCFDWIVTPRGKIMSEGHTTISEEMRERLAA